MNIYGLGVGISTVSKFSNRRGGMTHRDSPYISFDFYYIVPYMNIYGLGVGISTVSKFPNRRGWGTPVTSPIFHLICYIVQYMNTYG